MKICVFTLGCRVNGYESDALAKIFVDKGHEVVTDGLCEADLYVLNTCAVTAEAERKSVQCISRIKKLNKDAKIIVCGCASQHSPGRFKKEGVCAVWGTKDKLALSDFENLGTCDFMLGEKYEECNAHSTKAKTYVKIQDGCNNFCSYCIIPYLRGRSRSRRVEDALKEIKSCTSREVVITGINLSAYGKDSGESLIDLIEKLENENKRISFGSLSVSMITDEFLLALKKLKNFCPHFHISLQSGSDKVLKDMNRKYTSQEYLDAVKRIRKYFPSPSITTDIIVGFYSESEEDFEATFSFAKECNFSDIHIFPYSKREGTKAYDKGSLSGSIISNRVGRLTVLRDKMRKDYIQSLLQSRAKVLIEEKDGEYFVGYSERYVRVYLKGDFKAGDEAIVTCQKEYKDGVIAEEE